MSLLNQYKNQIQRLHNYLCQQHPQHRLQVHHSHIDIKTLYTSRVIAFVYLSTIYLWVLIDMGSITTNFIYLTLQGYFITWLFYAVVLQDYFLKAAYANHPVCAKLKHYIEILFETAFCFQIPITLVFWTFLFKILLDNNASPAEIIMNTNLHGGPIVCLSIQLYYNTFRFPKKHLIVLVTFGVVYLLINLIYSLSVAVIYKPIDWKSLLSYILVLMSIGFIVGAHYFGSFAYKKWKAPKLQNRIRQGLIDNNDDIAGQIQQTKNGNSQTTGTNPYRMTRQEQQRNGNDVNGRPNGNGGQALL